MSIDRLYQHEAIDMPIGISEKLKAWTLVLPEAANEMVFIPLDRITADEFAEALVEDGYTRIW